MISETVSSGLLAEDHSITAAIIAAVTLIGADVAMSIAKRRWPTLDKILEDEPVVIYLDGKLQEERMRMERVSVDDILESARQNHGIDSIDQVRIAVLERRGKISIIPVKAT